MNVLLSFDTEDFVTPKTDHAALYYARTLSEVGERSWNECHQSGDCARNAYFDCDMAANAQSPRPEAGR